MYRALFRLLPGPIWFRILTVTLIAAAVIALCFEVVFPFVDVWFPTQETFGRR